MAKRSLTTVTLVALFATVLPTLLVPAEEKNESKTITRWIKQLGSNNFGDREEATRALIRIGPAARVQLEIAAAGKDAEVRRRAEVVLERIEKDADTAALLLPKRVRLIYQDTAVTDAVADLAKKTGFAIQFEGDRTLLANRKITLDTGEVSFWEALDKFCRKAGLIERGPLPPKADQASGNGPEQMEKLLLERQMRVRMLRRGMYSPVPNNPVAGPIVLVEGKPDGLPRWHAGAVRIRALSAKTPAIGQVKTQEETFITLEVSPEPKLAWQGILDVRIDKAVDQAGQTLPQVLTGKLAGNEFYPDLNGMMWNGNAIFLDMDSGEPVDWLRHQRHFPVRFKIAGRPSQFLKEVQGTVAAQVQTPHQPLITVEDVLKSQGRTFKGPDGSYLKVVEVSRMDHGQVKLRVQVRPPPMGMNGMQMLGGGGRVFIQRFNGRMAVMAMQEVDNGGLQNLTLQDAKGQNFQLAIIDETLAPNGNGANLEYHLVFQPRPAMGDASKFVYSGRRLVTIEIPFTLKDVPLP